MLIVSSATSSEGFLIFTAKYEAVPVHARFEIPFLPTVAVWRYHTISCLPLDHCNSRLLCLISDAV